MRYQQAKRTVKIEIPGGLDATGLSRLLKDEGLILDVPTFVQMIETQNAMPRLRPGGYTIKAPAKAQELLDQIAPPIQSEAPAEDQLEPQ